MLYCPLLFSSMLLPVFSPNLSTTFSQSFSFYIFFIFLAMFLGDQEDASKYMEKVEKLLINTPSGRNFETTLHLLFAANFLVCLSSFESVENILNLVKFLLNHQVHFCKVYCRRVLSIYSFVRPFHI